MKTLGTDQFLAMKFERLPLNEPWYGVMGRLPKYFTMLFYGPSSNGKTEGVLQFTKELCQHGKVEWVEYESGHSGDIQDAVARNNMKGLPITWTDPWEEKKAKSAPKTAFGDIPLSKDTNTDRLFMELVEKIARKKSATYWIINSIDASGFTSKQILYLIRKFGKKKGLVFIGLSDGMKFSTIRVSATKEAYAQGQVAITVYNYIGGAMKNRFGGEAKWVIYEKKAREMDPLFFAQQDAAAAPKKKERKKRTPTVRQAHDDKKVTNDIFNQEKPQQEAVNQ